MFGIDDAIVGGVVGTIGKIIDKIFPDPGQAAAAKLEALRLAQAGELETLKTQISVILAEAQSQDKWTSRARPGFLYVMYIYMLAAIPMGVLFAFKPEIATSVTIGVQNWLAGIPEPIIALFGAGYLGYVGARSWDKGKVSGWRGKRG